MAVANAAPLHPKVAGATVGGSFATFAVACLAWAGVIVPRDVSDSAVVLAAAIGAYCAKGHDHE